MPNILKHIIMKKTIMLVVMLVAVFCANAQTQLSINNARSVDYTFNLYGNTGPNCNTAPTNNVGASATTIYAGTTIGPSPINNNSLWQWTPFMTPLGMIDYIEISDACGSAIVGASACTPNSQIGQFTDCSGYNVTVKLIVTGSNFSVSIY